MPEGIAMLNLYEYLTHTAARLPEKTAFADDARSFSFRALKTAAESVGTAVSKSCPVRSMVAVLADRSAVTAVGIVSCLAAGCCYVPLDPRMPEDRMRDILAKVRPALLLYTAHDAKIAAKYADMTGTLAVEDAENVTADENLLAARRENVLDIDPAYMIFTSGSTGVPKGIPVSHRSVIDFTDWMTAFCGIDETWVLGNQAPFFFDLSVKDFYQTLSQGCTTYVLPKKLFSFPTLLVDYLNERGVTGLIWATSAFRMTAESGIFAKKRLDSVRHVILGGEALQAKHLNLWKTATAACEFINLYGPTEVTVDCTAYKIERNFDDGEPVPIGKACRNMEVFLLDDDLKPVSDGEPGEICVRGIGLALGYYGDDEKTAAAFVQNPMNPAYPDRLYRTGDIAKRGDDGNLYYLSRRDGQIKHMGYRIELGEIETALNAVDGIRDCACFFDSGNDRIVACLLTKMSEADVLSAVKNRLPKYMMPNVWRMYDRFPATANGKIDRPALKEAYFREEN